MPRHNSLTRWFHVTAVVLVGLILVTASWVSAQSDSSKSTADNTAQTGEAPAGKRAANVADLSRVIMTPERQAAAMKFAELHHPELYQLLNTLKKSRRPEYQRAVRQLYNDSERLARFKERTPSRYELSLTEWQLDSRLRLLVARMTMSDDPELQAQLQDLLKKRMDVRLQLLRLDRERQAARLAKLDEQIQEIEDDRELAIEKDLLRIQRSLGVGKQRTPRRGPAANEKPQPNPNATTSQEGN